MTETIYFQSIRGSTLKKHYSCLLAGTFLLFLLGSCTTPIIGYNTAGKLNKNEDYKSVVAYLDRDPVFEKELTLQGSKDKFKVLIYKRWIQTYALGFNFLYSDKYDLFALAFKNEKLYYWGNLDDFKRTDDDVANGLGVLISETWIKQ